MKAIWKLAAFIALAIVLQSCKNENLKIITTTTSDNYNIVILSNNGSIKNGKGRFYLEFQNAGSHQPVNVGNVQVQANMSMPGMPMVKDAEVATTDQPGRYAVDYDLSMSGTWTLNIRYDNNKSATLLITID